MRSTPENPSPDRVLTSGLCQDSIRTQSPDIKPLCLQALKATKRRVDWRWRGTQSLAPDTPLPHDVYRRSYLHLCLDYPCLPHCLQNHSRLPQAHCCRSPKYVMRCCRCMAQEVHRRRTVPRCLFLLQRYVYRYCWFCAEI